MMARMRSNDLRDELQEGIEPAPMPPRAPDGGLEFTPAVPIEEGPPRLCESGPCRHYHRLDVQMDAANPRAERVNGRLVRHAKVFHVLVNHYCYPDVGIETNLGSMPVLSCNRWDPELGILARLTGGVGRARRRYEREFGAFEAAREAEARALAEAAGLVADPIPLVVIFSRVDAEAQPVEVAMDGDMTVVGVIGAAVRRTAIQLEQHTYTVEIDGAPVGNLDATLLELELVPGTRIVVNLSHEPKEPA